jgi:hypothetical protein
VQPTTLRSLFLIDLLLHQAYFPDTPRRIWLRRLDAREDCWPQLDHDLSQVCPPF